jgi:hypothetical protein
MPIKRYLFGLDNTICTTINSDYANAKPIQCRIDYINNLKKEGNYIMIWSDRDEQSQGECHTALTYKQLSEWKVQYDKLILYKPVFDIHYDFNSYNIDHFMPISHVKFELPKFSDR